MKLQTLACSLCYSSRGLKALPPASGARSNAASKRIVPFSLLAIGAMLEARAMGLIIPADLSITGFDDVAMSIQIEPPLTTMWVDNAEIGRLAARDLLARLSGITPPPIPALIPVFVERSSTAAPRRHELAPSG